LASAGTTSYTQRDATWTCLHIRRLTKSFEEALNRKGFRFIEVITPCATLYSRLNRLGTGLDLMRFYHDNAEIRNGADTRDVDIGFQENIVCGKFLDTERPTFLEMLHENYQKVLGDKYVPMPPEGGMLHG
jgi:2-oxoglutarate ferredoxin oxidoreductase subunit beta